MCPTKTDSYQHSWQCHQHIHPVIAQLDAGHVGEGRCGKQVFLAGILFAAFQIDGLILGASPFHFVAGGIQEGFEGDAAFLFRTLGIVF